VKTKSADDAAMGLQGLRLLPLIHEGDTGSTEHCIICSVAGAIDIFGVKEEPG
jgi:hypothetical protein